MKRHHLIQGFLLLCWPLFLGSGVQYTAKGELVSNRMRHATDNKWG